MLTADPRRFLKAQVSPESLSGNPRALSAFSTHISITGPQGGLGLGI